MHMADALVSPTVGGAMWLASGGLLAWCSRRLRQAQDLGLVPLMGVLGAFVFAAQMINFSIPGAGSSGHLGGALLLAVLLGPHAAFLVIASVLTVQALFFGDGGLLALGCNLFNLGFFPVFVAYPLIYRPLVGPGYRSRRAWGVTVLAAVVGLQLGALGVVVEAWLSGRSALPLGGFLALMQPIHLAIGVVEGLATAAVVAFVAEARPEALKAAAVPGAAPGVRWRVLGGVALAAVLLGGLVSWFASGHPDGLEWSIARLTGSLDVGERPSALHERLGALQERTAIMPEYAPRSAAAPPTEEAETAAGNWPAVDAGTSLAGLVGAGLTLILAGLLGLVLRCRSQGQVSLAAGRS
jgi:cobalt/nickel transport system permease protein